MDCLFVNPNSSKVYQDLAKDYSAKETPTWSLLLAQALRKEFGVGILDCDAERLDNNTALQKVIDIKPRLVCFVVYGQNPNSGTTNMSGAISLAKLIKDNTNSKIAFIGSHTSALPEEVLAYKFVDFVMIGDGLHALQILLRTNMQDFLDKIPGLGYKDNFLFPRFNDAKLATNLDIDLPGYAWDLLPYKNKPLDLYRSHFWHTNYNHEKRTPFAAVYSSLGCNFKCLSGDTLINTLYGLKSIKQLATQKTYPIYTYDRNTGDVLITDAINIQKTQKNTQLVRVIFDNNSYIDCTPDHKFLTFKNGNQSVPTREYEIEAQYLKPKTSVIALRHDTNPYGYSVIGWRRKFAFEHRLIMEYKLGRKMSRSESVHHIDHNKGNNHPDNLLFCHDLKEHYQYHPEVSERMKQNNPSKYWTEESKIKMSKALCGQKRTFEQRLKYRESKLGTKNPNYKHGKSINDSRIKEINHKVKEVIWLEQKEDVYCMEVPGYNWFFANNVLVHNCSFCMINSVNRTSLSQADASESSGMRFWSTDHMINILDELVNNYGVETIRFSDEMFLLNKKYYEPLIDKIIERGYKINTWTYSRIDTVKPQILDKLKKAGVNWLALGVEAANQQIRREIDKGKFEDVNIRNVMQQIQDVGINRAANYIFGFPNERIEDLQATLDLALELNTEFANFYTATALPGSPLYNEAKMNGWKLPSTFEGFGFLAKEFEPLPTNYLSGSEVLKFRDKAWHIYYENLTFLNMIEQKFGTNIRTNIEAQTKIKIQRDFIKS